MKLRKLSKVMVLALALSMTTPSIGNVAQVTTVQAAAKVSSKKYTCKVTVKKPNKYLKGAPFNAKETTIDKYSAVVPSKWVEKKESISGIPMYTFTPEGKDIMSNIIVTTIYSNADSENFDTYAELLKAQVTKDYMETLFATQTGTEITISDFEFATSETNAGKATKISYTAKVSSGESIKQTIYCLFADGYTTEIMITDAEEEITPDLYEVADYLINSLIFNK